MSCLLAIGLSFLFWLPTIIASVVWGWVGFWISLLFWLILGSFVLLAAAISAKSDE